MRLFQSIIALAITLLPNAAFAQVSNDNEDGVCKVDKHAQKFREGEIIVKLKASSIAKVKGSKGALTSGVSALDKVLKAIGVSESEELMPLTGKTNVGRKLKAYNGSAVTVRDMSKTYLMKFDKNKTVNEAINAIKDIEDVEFAEPNYLVYTMSTEEEPKAVDVWNDPLVNQQWGLDALHLPAMSTLPKITTKRPVIAILDTGVDITHPDLEANIWTNLREADGQGGYDDDNNGFADDIHGWDFVNQTGNMRDNNGHGTHCAGIAAAVGNNGLGIVGANPDAFIMPITVMQSDGTGDVATIIKGVDYATANGADILSMSIGLYNETNALEQALAKAYSKSIIFGAAGNDCLPIDKGFMCPKCSQIGMPMFPAAYTFVLGVEAYNTKFSNYDNDGPVYSNYGEEKLYNYELKAPGKDIYSTFPNGKYKSMSGTSMACPFAAGAVSKLLEDKDYNNKEILWGDLINMSSPMVNVRKAYDVTDSDRKPILEFTTISFNDELGDNDGRIDAGENILVCPTIRNFWGCAKNVELSLELGENEDSSAIEIYNPVVHMSQEISSYAKVKLDTPFRIKISDKCQDNKKIRFTMTAICDNVSELVRQDFTLTVENGLEIGGMLSDDLTLLPNVHYVVTKNLAIPKGVTMTIKPGTTLEFKYGTGLSCDGKLNAVGTRDSLITFIGSSTPMPWGGGIRPGNNRLSYVKFKDFIPSGYFIEGTNTGVELDNCIFDNIECGQGLFTNCNYLTNNNITNCKCYNSGISEQALCRNNNLINNKPYRKGFVEISRRGDNVGNSIFNNFVNPKGMNEVGGYDSGICIRDNGQPSMIDVVDDLYLGSFHQNIFSKSIWDVNNPIEAMGYAAISLNSISDRPNFQNHGIVWKILVDGFDAQDQYEELPPLGVGKHKFEVFFNRPVNTTKTSYLGMGVRPPYTQTIICEDENWSQDSLKYTAYLTITGKRNIDGINRIRCFGFEDNEHFEIPEEMYRFNVNVQAAGSMSTGFIGEAGLGKVTLSWADAQNSFDDFLGYNLYRFEDPKDDSNESVRGMWDENGNYYEEKGHWENGNWIKFDSQPITKVNEQLLDNETLEYVDYDVKPGTTYYYQYKVITTDLKETDPSNIVAVTPQTSTLGDANGSGDVDVADVITTVNYAAGQQPKPFIYEAADMNKDLTIDILDVIGIIKKITNPAASAQAMAEATATYSVENGIVYVECNAPLAGVQVLVNVNEKADITTTAELNGFEQTGAWLSDNDYIFLGYNMNGKTISAGKHAILNIGNASISDIRLSDANGRNIKAIADDTVTKVDNMASRVMTQKGVFTLSGQKISGKDKTKSLPKGVYIINGQKVVK